MQYIKHWRSNDNWLVMSLLGAAFTALVYFGVINHDAFTQFTYALAGVPQTQVAAAATATIYPSLQPQEGLVDPSLAYNVGGVNDYGTPFFLDLMKMARTWNADATAGGGLSMDQMVAAGVTFDQNGWPTYIPSSVKDVFSWFSFPGQNGMQYGIGNNIGGRYDLTYQGTGSVQVNFYGKSTSKVVSTQPGKIVFDLDNAQGTWRVSILSTDPNHTGDYIRNIHIVREDYQALYNSGEIFNPSFIAMVKDVRLVRFMDWMDTNNSTYTTWAQYPTADHYTWTQGVPVSVMVQLANEIGADPWFNMPFHADDNFVQQFASYVHANLNPKLVAHVELSNEVWNWGFKQSHDAYDLAVSTFGVTGGAGWVNYYGMRASQVMKIWTTVYGADAKSRLLRIVGTQTAYVALTPQILTAPMWKTADPSHYVAPYTYFDALAVTSYFGGGNIHSTSSARDLLNQVALSTSTADSYMQKLEDQPYPTSGTISIAAGTGSANISVIGVGTHFTTEVRPREIISFGNKFYRVDRITSDTQLLLTDHYNGPAMTNVPYHVYWESGVQMVGYLLQQQKAFADQYGLKLVLYEGGQSILYSPMAKGLTADEQNRLTSYLAHYVRTSQMAEVYGQLWNIIKPYIDGPFMQFSSDGMPSKYGAWGLYATYTDNSPRAQTLVALNQSMRPWWQTNRGSGGDTTFLQGVVKTGSGMIVGTNGDDHLIGSSGDDTFYPGLGNDGVNGNGGTDAVLFEGPHTAYTVTTSGQGYLVTGPDGHDYLYNIALLQFSDGTYQVQKLSTDGAAAPVVPPSTSTSTVPATVIPTLTLQVLPASVTAGQSAVVTWTSASASSCIASGDWTGTKAAVGSYTAGVNTTKSQYTYTLTCTGTGGSISKTVTLSVSSTGTPASSANTGSGSVANGGTQTTTPGSATTPVPTVNLSVSPTSITAGQSAKLTWSSQNASSCVSSGAWTGGRILGNSISTGAMSNPGSYTYTLSCTGAGGTTVKSATLQVTAPRTTTPTQTTIYAPSITAFSLTPSSISVGSASTLTWNVAHANSCTASNSWSGTKPLSGSVTISGLLLTGSYTYTLTCTGTGGTISDSVVLNVVAPTTSRNGLNG